LPLCSMILVQTSCHDTFTHISPDSGPCFGMVQRYFYNPTKMSCEIFNYGGCLGNQNNFVTEKECLQRCRPEAVCRLPMDAKPCVGSPPIWTFNSTSGLCVPFKQGYCQANGNKFYTKSECDEYCGVIKAGEANGAIFSHKSQRSQIKKCPNFFVSVKVVLFWSEAESVAQLLK
uniref:BPTI/Kunitz inhibitor domain-containing protein n=1 Tax=Oryzias sinensis TaxID=183150 RepID=A0A8C7ZLQ8_9TELE